MFFEHSPAIWSDYPELVAGAVFVTGITSDAVADSRIAMFTAIADSRLAANSEGEFPEIQAWRRAFSRMGLRPTQYRCASEALLRRYRKERRLPRIHPLVDVCNAVSLAFAMPIAVFDVDRISENLVVGYARGAEMYLPLWLRLMGALNTPIFNIKVVRWPQVVTSSASEETSAFVESHPSFVLGQVP